MRGGIGSLTYYNKINQLHKYSISNKVLIYNNTSLPICQNGLVVWNWFGVQGLGIDPNADLE